MREIPPLSLLALRAVGPPTSGCNPEVTFGGPQACRAAGGNGDSDIDDVMTRQTSPSSSLKKRGSHDNTNNSASTSAAQREPTLTARLLRSLRHSTLPQRPYESGRPNANDVDIAHPWILAVHPPREPGNNAPLITSEDGSDPNVEAEILIIENGNHAVECLQLFIDAMIESGMSDSRMGVFFFREWVTAVTGLDEAEIEEARRNKKKKKRQKSGRSYGSLPLGSLSLHNFAQGSVHTFRSMEKANVGCCLGTLDISGVAGLTDDILSDVICAGSFSRLRRLSVKNCRKLTGKGIASLANLTKLCALDVGGCFNVHSEDVVSLIRSHPSTKKGRLTEIYASGLGWTDAALDEMVDATSAHLLSLAIGFSPHISGQGLILTLSKMAPKLTHLAVAFCSGINDAALSALGHKLPALTVLDIRGCSKVTSLSDLMKSRKERNQTLFVLARYSGISKTSLEETKRLYDGLNCILDGGGIGGGIRR